MKFPKKTASILAGGIGALVLAAPHAVAATPYWANTKNDIDSYPVTVYWCSGGTGVINPGRTTTKNVCGIKVRDDRYIHAFVKETGTMLVNQTNCSGRDKRVTFTTQTDTSRTAVVYYFDGWCV